MAMAGFTHLYPLASSPPPCLPHRCLLIDLLIRRSLRLPVDGNSVESWLWVDLQTSDDLLCAFL